MSDEQNTAAVIISSRGLVVAVIVEKGGGANLRKGVVPLLLLQNRGADGTLYFYYTWKTEDTTHNFTSTFSTSTRPSPPEVNDQYLST
jgi:hypothetical protein